MLRAVRNQVIVDVANEKFNQNEIYWIFENILSEIVVNCEEKDDTTEFTLAVKRMRSFLLHLYLDTSSDSRKTVSEQTSTICNEAAQHVNNDWSPFSMHILYLEMRESKVIFSWLWGESFLLFRYILDWY